MDVFINDVSAILPNSPVTNDTIEDVLGKVRGVPSKAKRLVLKSNQITQRYYALDPESGRLTHTNAQLTAEAVRRLQPYEGYVPGDIQCLCCGTTSPDLLFPGHALMVQGELGIPACEAVTTSGICLSGITAFKYACMSVAAGLASNAVATGSELASSYMRAQFLTPFYDGAADLETRPVRAFDADFLRWMLSDGAGAVFLSTKKRKDGLSLKVAWVDVISYAGASGDVHVRRRDEAGGRQHGRLAADRGVRTGSDAASVFSPAGHQASRCRNRANHGGSSCAGRSEAPPASRSGGLVPAPLFIGLLSPEILR